MARRGRGEGGVYQRHDHPTCPPAVDGERPEHRCRGRWVGTLDLGIVGGKRRRKTVYGRTRREAASKVQAALEQRRNLTLTVGRTPTVEEWLTYWLDQVCSERGTKVNTMKSYRSKVARYIVPELGGLRLDRLEPGHVRNLYNGMRQRGLAESTVRQTHAILRRALVVAEREGRVVRNAAALIDPPKTKRAARTALTLEQATRVLDGADLRWWVALLLGLRQGEALALSWADLDLDDNHLRVERNLVRVPGQGLIFDTPKSDASRRIVPLPEEMVAPFRTTLTRHLATGGTLDDLVFSRDGRPVDHRADWQAWTDRLDAVGVPHVPLHAARNTAATLLEYLGYPPRMVAEILGQSDVRVTFGYQSADYARRREALADYAAAIKALPASPDA